MAVRVGEINGVPGSIGHPDTQLPEMLAPCGKIRDREGEDVPASRRFSFSSQCLLEHENRGSRPKPHSTNATVGRVQPPQQGEAEEALVERHSTLHICDP